MNQPAIPSTVITQPLVHFGREICGDLACGLRREWLVTNGLGGYASGTLAGVNTRSYHGLLVAALNPPVDRTVLVGGLVEWATYDGHRYPLSTHEFADGTIAPDGYRHLQSFALEGTIPIWTFASCRRPAGAAHLDGIRRQHHLRPLSSAARLAGGAVGDHPIGNLSRFSRVVVWSGVAAWRRSDVPGCHHSGV